MIKCDRLGTGHGPLHQTRAWYLNPGAPDQAKLKEAAVRRARAYP